MMKCMTKILLLIASIAAPTVMEASPAPRQWTMNQNDSPKVSVAQGCLVISAATDCDAAFEIYSITGQLVKRVKLANGTATVELHRGCYIIRCQNWSKKVVVN